VKKHVGRRPGRRHVRSFSAAFMAAVLFGGLVTVPPAGAAGTCTDLLKPEVVPAEDLEAGMTGLGWTAVKGRNPVSFNVEILEVLEDGVAPGVPFVLIEVSGPVIRNTGGIAAGFSGSPIYIGGTWAATVAYGYAFADHRIGGAVPAEHMLRLFDLPEASTARAARDVAPYELPIPNAVRLPQWMRQSVARATGQPAGSLPTTAEQLKIPMAVSGLQARRRAELQTDLDEKHWPTVVTPGSTATGAPSGVPPAPLEPGEPLAGVLSYGDITMAGIGTTSAICGNLALGFGHPFFFSGPISMGLHAANVATVVRDPSHTFGPFKIAKVAEHHGRLDQDRLVGVRGIEGATVDVAAVNSDFDNLDLGTNRAGTTNVVFQEAFPLVSLYHALGNWDRVFDRIGEGTLRMALTLNGRRAGGEPFMVNREDMNFSDFDVAFPASHDMYSILRTIQDNPFEDVVFDSVSLTGSITQEELRSTITRVQSSTSLRPAFRVRQEIRVRPGRLIRLRVFLERADGSDWTVDMAVRMPANAGSRAVLRVEGGGFDDGYYYYFGPATRDRAPSGTEGHIDPPDDFDDMIDRIQSQAHANDIIATLFSRNEELLRERRQAQEEIVMGRQTFPVVVVR
jgi:hypothetical protein